MRACLLGGGGWNRSCTRALTPPTPVPPPPPPPHTLTRLAATFWRAPTLTWRAGRSRWVPGWGGLACCCVCASAFVCVWVGGGVPSTPSTAPLARVCVGAFHTLQCLPRAPACLGARPARLSLRAPSTPLTPHPTRPAPHLHPPLAPPPPRPRPAPPAPPPPLRRAWTSGAGTTPSCCCWLCVWTWPTITQRQVERGRVCVCACRLGACGVCAPVGWGVCVPVEWGVCVPVGWGVCVPAVCVHVRVPPSHLPGWAAASALKGASRTLTHTHTHTHTGARPPPDPPPPPPFTHTGCQWGGARCCRAAAVGAVGAPVCARLLACSGGGASGLGGRVDGRVHSVRGGWWWVGGWVGL